MDGRKTLSRRSFLATGSKLGLAAIFSDQITSIALGQQKSSPPLGSVLGATIPKQTLFDPLHNITRAMFAENIGTIFSFSQGGVWLSEMRLIGVNNLNPKGFKGNPKSGRECFALVFLGPADLPLGQDTYRLAHNSLGTFDLFIVPGASDRESISYGADINRLYP